MTAVGHGRRLSRVTTWLSHIGQMDRALLVVLGGLSLLGVPVMVDLARNYWSTTAGAQEPIILVSGLWLLWRERDLVLFQPGSIPGAWLLLLLPFLALYLFGRSLHLLGTEAIALYLVTILLGCFYVGLPAMRRMWFAWLYLAFLIKPPQELVTRLTGPLQIGLSDVSVRLLSLAGYPVGSAGVTIQVGQYELLVAQACAGLGSLVALLAIGLLYVHLTRPEGRVHTALLLVGIIPLALVANLLRVLIIILLTYYAGDGVAQSLAHEIAGLGTFMLSLFGMVALDGLIGLVALGDAR